MSADCSGSFNFFVRVFKVFGLATFFVFSKDDDLTFLGSPIAVFYNCILIFIVLTSNVATIYTLLTRFTETLTLFHIIDFFGILLGTATSLLILASYGLNRTSCLKLTSDIYSLNSRINKLIDTKERPKLYWTSLITMFYLLTTASLFAIAVTDTKSVILLSSAFRNTVIAWLLFQYTLVAVTLLGMFRKINAALLSLVKTRRLSLNFANIGSEYDEKQGKLMTARDLHYSLLEACRRVVKFYELMVFGCIAYVVIYLIVFAYIFLSVLIERRGLITFTWIEYLYFFLWLLMLTASFVMLSRYTARTTDEIGKTRTIIHQLIEKTMSSKLLAELEEFSLYLLHARFEFTAVGFLVINGSLVQSIFSSITTYLVILIQFQLTSSSGETPR